jgi:hypothetical protein
MTARGATGGGRLVRLVHQGGKARSTGRIARCVVLCCGSGISLQ